MLSAQKNMSQMGSTIWSAWPMPVASVMARMKMPMNFWPSCAPCMNATPAPATIWSHLNAWSSFVRSKCLNTRITTFETTQPKPKPMKVESRMP